MAVLGYDKRGVGGSTGDWKNASLDDLAGDVIAAYENLRTRGDIRSDRIGRILVEPGQLRQLPPKKAITASGQTVTRR
jgi:hypothetical protein